MSGILALIPARGGSRSIPRKNLVTIGGLPLIAHSIQHARAARAITRVVVSTDDDEIADVSRKFGAEVPFKRPPSIAGDFATDLEVFRHTLEWFESEEGYCPDLVVHLRPTGPVRRVALIEEAIRVMQQAPEADSLRSVSLAQQTPYKMWRIEHGLLKPLIADLPEAHSMPRQQLPLVYWQNGYVDIVRPRTVVKLLSMVGDSVLPFVVEEPIYEIDYPENLPVVERALEALAAGRLPSGPGGQVRHSV